MTIASMLAELPEKSCEAMRPVSAKCYWCDTSEPLVFASKNVRLELGARAATTHCRHRRNNTPDTTQTTRAIN